MARKASHGWSTRQQGGFRPAGPVRNVFKKREKADKINQNMSLYTASINI